MTNRIIINTIYFIKHEAHKLAYNLGNEYFNTANM